MLESRGTVKTLPPPKSSEGWKIQYASGSGIPFLEDGTTRIWCMEVFQAQSTEAPVQDMPPELDLNQITAADGSEPKTPTTGPPVMTAAMTGLVPGYLA